MSAILDPASMLVAPGYARVDLAWSEVVAIPRPNLITSVFYTVPGKYMDIFRSVVVNVVTSAVAGNRGLLLGFANADGFQIANIPAPVTIGPSVVSTIDYCVGGNSSYGVAPIVQIADQVVGIAAFLLQAGFTATLSLANGQAGDSILGETAEIVHIPTGPEVRHAADTLPTVTPVLL